MLHLLSASNATLKLILYIVTRLGQTLTHWGPAPHICVGGLCQLCSKKWLGTILAPRHFLNQCWVLTANSPYNRFQWNSLPYLHFFSATNDFEMVVWDFSSSKISRPQWVKGPLTCKICIIYSESWCFNNHFDTKKFETNIYLMSNINLKFQKGNPKYIFCT